MGTYILIAMAIILVAAVVSYGISEWANIKKATAVKPEIHDLTREEFEALWNVIGMEDADE